MHSFFPAELSSSSLSKKNDSRGVRGHAPLNIFKNLHTVMAILVLFEQFSGKFCLWFWPLIFNTGTLPNIMHFRLVLVMLA